jgi:hypothetical protein
LELHMECSGDFRWHQRTHANRPSMPTILQSMGSELESAVAWSDRRVRELVARRFRFLWTRLAGAVVLILALLIVFFIGARHDITAMIVIGFGGTGATAYLGIPGPTHQAFRQRRATHALKSVPLEPRALSVRTILVKTPRANRIAEWYLPATSWGAKSAVSLEGDDDHRTFEVKLLGWPHRPNVPRLLEDRVLLGPKTPTGARFEGSFGEAALVARGPRGTLVIVSNTYDSILMN